MTADDLAVPVDLGEAGAWIATDDERGAADERLRRAKKHGAFNPELSQAEVDAAGRALGGIDREIREAVEAFDALPDWAKQDQARIASEGKIVQWIP